MFSDHLKPVEEAPAKTLLGVAACLVILCQLVAMVIVVDGQVRKAELRDAGYVTQRVAVAQCIESTVGFARQACLQDAYSRGKPGAVSQQAIADASPPTIGQTRVEGLMPASYVGTNH